MNPETHEPPLKWSNIILLVDSSWMAGLNIRQPEGRRVQAQIVLARCCMSASSARASRASAGPKAGGFCWLSKVGTTFETQDRLSSLFLRLEVIHLMCLAFYTFCVFSIR